MLTRVWNESDPPDNTAIGYGAQKMREAKEDIEEREQVNHYFNDGETDTSVAGCDGHHRYVTFVEQASDPDAIADTAIMFAKDVSGDTALYVKTSAGSVRIF